MPPPVDDPIFDMAIVPPPHALLGDVAHFPGYITISCFEELYDEELRALDRGLTMLKTKWKPDAALRAAVPWADQSLIDLLSRVFRDWDTRSPIGARPGTTLSSCKARIKDGDTKWRCGTLRWALPPASKKRKRWDSDGDNNYDGQHTQPAPPVPVYTGGNGPPAGRRAGDPVFLRAHISGANGCIQIDAVNSQGHYVNKSYILLTPGVSLARAESEAIKAWQRAHEAAFRLNNTKVMIWWARKLIHSWSAEGSRRDGEVPAGLELMGDWLHKPQSMIEIESLEIRKMIARHEYVEDYEEDEQMISLV